jgi:hypothetical protein
MLNLLKLDDCARSAVYRDCLLEFDGYHRPCARPSMRTLYFDLRVLHPQDVLTRPAQRYLQKSSDYDYLSVERGKSTSSQCLHQLKVRDSQLSR